MLLTDHVIELVCRLVHLLHVTEDLAGFTFHELEVCGLLFGFHLGLRFLGLDCLLAFLFFFGGFALLFGLFLGYFDWADLLVELVNLTARGVERGGDFVLLFVAGFTFPEFRECFLEAFELYAVIGLCPGETGELAIIDFGFEFIGDSLRALNLAGKLAHSLVQRLIRVGDLPALSWIECLETHESKVRLDRKFLRVIG